MLVFITTQKVLEASKMLEAREKVLEARENMLEDNRKAVQVKREGTQSKGKHARDNERDISSSLDRCSHTAI